MRRTVISDLMSTTGSRSCRALLPDSAPRGSVPLVIHAVGPRARKSLLRYAATIARSLLRHHYYDTNFAARHFNVEQIAQYAEVAIEALLNALDAQQPSAALLPTCRKSCPNRPRTSFRYTYPGDIGSQPCRPEPNRRHRLAPRAATGRRNWHRHEPRAICPVTSWLTLAPSNNAPGRETAQAPTTQPFRPPA
jgi:hypothetical protein